MFLKTILIEESHIWIYNIGYLDSLPFTPFAGVGLFIVFPQQLWMRAHQRFPIKNQSSTSLVLEDEVSKIL